MPARWLLRGSLCGFGGVRGNSQKTDCAKLPNGTSKSYCACPNPPMRAQAVLHKKTEPLAGFCWRVCLPIAVVHAVPIFLSPECRIKHAGSICIGHFCQVPYFLPRLCDSVLPARRFVPLLVLLLRRALLAFFAMRGLVTFLCPMITLL